MQCKKLEFELHRQSIKPTPKGLYGRVCELSQSEITHTAFFTSGANPFTALIRWQAFAIETLMQWAVASKLAACWPDVLPKLTPILTMPLLNAIALNFSNCWVRLSIWLSQRVTIVAASCIPSMLVAA